MDNTMDSFEFTDEMNARNDEIDNAVYVLLLTLTEKVRRRVVLGYGSYRSCY